MLRSFLYVCIAACIDRARGTYLSTDYIAYNSGELGHQPFQQYRSTNQFGPVFQVTKWDKEAVSQAGSHIFMRHDGHHGTDRSRLSSPMIVDAEDLSMVYVNRSFVNVFDVRIQENYGHKYLTFWEGHNIGGFGDGFGLAYDESYRLVYNITAHSPNHMDLHEFAFTGHGSALVAAVQWLPADSLHWTDYKPNKKGFILDSRFQEIDLETNKLLFDWRASDHISPIESMEHRSNDWDPYHLNSIQKTRAGNYLVSFRHLHSIMMVDGTTGDILWRLGGKENMFDELPPPDGVNPTRPLLKNIKWQHHALYVDGTNETEMTVFDNYVKSTSHGQCTSDCSRGLHIAIHSDASPPTVQLLGEYLHPAQVQAASQGSVQPLSPVVKPGGGGTSDIGNLFVGWGHSPGFTEHTSSGDTVLDVQFAPWHSTEIRDSLDNYRAYKMDWRARPYWDPVMTIERNMTDSSFNITAVGNITAFVSWNGATEVKEWVIHAGRERDHANKYELARSPRSGFETTLVFAATGMRYIWAEALDKDGLVLRASKFIELNTWTQEPTSSEDGAESTSSSTSSSTADSTKSETVTMSTAKAVSLAVGIGACGLMLGAVAVYFWRGLSSYDRLVDGNMSEERYLELEARLDARLEAELLYGADSLEGEIDNDHMPPQTDFAVDSDDEEGGGAREDAPLNR